MPAMNQLDMKGRTAVVTGGAAGIGYAIAERLVKSGARVTLWDRDEKALDASARSLGRGAHGTQVDVSQESSVATALAETLRHSPKIDALVCSAGITGPNLTVADYPVADWKQVLDINLTGVFLCNRALIPHMAKNDYGRIVNIASIAGVISLTKSLGKEVAKTGIRVNCVTPAAVKTGMFSQMTQAHIDFMLSKIPMGRFGQVEEIAALVAWLCTEDCSFSTGAVFDLSGGRAVY
jgi:3-oxoacyl-[acyl-carrier protein] reductase